jgi:hypothetical protein
VKNRDFAGLAAVVLATGVVLAVVIATAGAAISHREFSPDETTLLSTVLGAAIGAVATYLGTHGRRPDESTHKGGPAMETPPTPPEPQPEPQPEPEPEPERTEEEEADMTQGMGPGDDAEAT